MEMVERASAYAGVEGEKLVGTSGPAELVRATWSELERAAKNGGPRPLDPNDYHLDAPYADAPLYWMSGREIRRGPDGYAETPILAPVQLAYLFCNLDEPDLIDAPGSTGLAAGRTAAEARLAALTEILERDAQATTPYHRSGCFSLRAEDGFVAGLLADYAARGINVQFQDLTGPLGLPCYKCFVVGPRGQIAAGYGAGLSGRKALLSALTETPYPYPGGPPSGPLLRRLPQIRFEDLPDHSLNSPEQDLALLETLLCANGLNPAYLDLTRADLGFPVQRCLLKGLEPTADFDALARTPERLYFNYIKLWTPA